LGIFAFGWFMTTLAGMLSVEWWQAKHHQAQQCGQMGFSSATSICGFSRHLGGIHISNSTVKTFYGWIMQFTCTLALQACGCSVKKCARQNRLHGHIFKKTKIIPSEKSGCMLFWNAFVTRSLRTYLEEGSNINKDNGGLLPKTQAQCVFTGSD
jgi:hypothetical protein